jgi:hypothetical protein
MRPVQPVTYRGHPPALPEAGNDFLPPEYNFVLFFSLPFYPLRKAFRKTITFHGHLSLALGSTVYQLHDPKKLRSHFLVSRMPTTSWLFEDGRWFEWDPSSEHFRHVHLYERAEIKRTVVFYAALKNFPLSKQTLYENYFETLESDYQRGQYQFHLFDNNCTGAVNHVLYREGWIKKGVLDFLPAWAFKRLIGAWEKNNLDFTTGYIDEYQHAHFKLHKLCLGMFTLAPDRELAHWLNKKSAA